MNLTVIPLLCIAAAILTVYIPFGAVGWARMQLGYDYHKPRAMFDQLPPYAQRATWAHQNGFETFGPFAAAALIAYVTGPHEGLLYQGLSGDQWISILGIVFLIARLLYALFYIIDFPYARSFSYVLGATCTLGLLAISLSPLLTLA